jgi:hypothetical protein
MAGARTMIPQPTPADKLPPPAAPAHYLPAPPSSLRVTSVLAGGTRELAIICKPTSRFLCTRMALLTWRSPRESNRRSSVFQRWLASKLELTLSFKPVPVRPGR